MAVFGIVRCEAVLVLALSCHYDSLSFSLNLRKDDAVDLGQALAKKFSSNTLARWLKHELKMVSVGYTTSGQALVGLSGKLSTSRRLRWDWLVLDLWDEGRTNCGTLPEFLLRLDELLLNLVQESIHLAQLRYEGVSRVRGDGVRLELLGSGSSGIGCQSIGGDSRSPRTEFRGSCRLSTSGYRGAEGPSCGAGKSGCIIGGIDYWETICFASCEM
ncbi:hypothetical protein BHM03_00005424 [Ensete ventricosum]|uniref:Uncharacterized protein n=1 Tax=Ensete ventricosum TaxID=4639 RepID=A0A445MB60_ENSVE|nr:hypothetical protein BHM03_00005424 [Ensete ventricosum]